MLKETTFITNLFKHTDLKLHFKTKNSKEHNLNTPPTPPSPQKKLIIRMTNILPEAYINSHVLIVARLMLAKQAVVSLLRDLMYTIFLIGITIQLQNLHNIS